MTRVLLFAKAPRPGSVKTRLARDIGDEAATAAYRSVGRQVFQQVAPSYRVTVWYDPPDAEDEMHAWLGDGDFRAQEGSDLGARMAHALAVHFREDEKGPCVVIGADAPHVTAQTIAQAERELEVVDVVLGPAVDGGYYLVGLHRPAPSLFVDVPWGTAGVLDITVARCAACDLSCSTLAPLRDLDTVRDLDLLNGERT